MSDAPERIWLDWEGPHEADNNLCFEKYSFKCASQHEYVRADLIPDMIEAARREGAEAMIAARNATP